MPKTKLLLLISVVIAGALFMYPSKVMCGVPGYSCATAPISPEFPSTAYYEIQPLGITLIESMTQQNTGLQYSSGNE